MRSAWLVRFGTWASIAAAGCGGGGKVDKLEGQVTAYQQELAALRTQVSDLQTRVTKLEAAPTPPPAPPPPPAASCAHVRLDAVGPSKIAVIKTVRVLRPDLSLAAAKALVESAPAVIAEARAATEAEAMRASLVTEGATVTLVPAPCP